MNISIFGLGYVGVVTAACLSRSGHTIVGVDVLAEKVEALARGESPIVEPEVPELLKQAFEKGTLSATTNVSDAIQRTGYSIICVGTPSSSGGMPEMTYIESVCKEIADAVRRKNSPHFVILRSTILPGSTAQIAKNYFADLMETHRVHLYFYPEFLRESTAVQDFIDPSLNVIGGKEADQSIADIAFLFAQPPQVVDWQTAELLKYACNAWHANKIAFANEIGRIGKFHDIDSRRVMHLLCEDRRLNISNYYMKPGNPFGGSCLPKDVLALSQFSRKTGLFSPVIENLLDSNRRHLTSMLQLVENSGKKEIIILGLTFKSESDDLRESSMVSLAQTLLGNGYTVRIFDPNLQLNRLTGRNKLQIENRMPHLASLLQPTLQKALGASGLIVASQKVAAIDEILPHITANHQILDVNGWNELSTLPCAYEGLCW